MENTNTIHVQNIKL